MDEHIFDKVQEVDMQKTMKDYYIDYAMSVIASRALPDVRDGLKPVQRRILYSMVELNNGPDKPHRKCARIVGDTMGKYHPHGDSSIYEALVKLAQDFNTRYPLVDGHGNFGSVDGDGAAAMRYTEARLSKISMEMTADLNKDTVDFIPNFDETEKEPTVLPSRYPNLLVNGTSGIAVGMATNIPPHNLREVIGAVVKIIDNKINEDRETTLEEILEIVKGPDFPTGGTIIGKTAIEEAYRTGRAKIRVRAVTNIEPMPNGKNRIVVTELPYMVNKARLIENIADLVRDKRVEGITDLRDESDREGMRIAIELRRDVNPNIILNQLYKHTQLQDTFGVIMLALVDNQPKVLNLYEMLKYYLMHQEDVVTRRTKYDLNKAAELQYGKLPQLEKKEMKILPQEKIGLYLAEAEKRGLLAAFYLELTTGLRRGELLALQWTDLDVENRTLAVTKQVNRINGELVVSPPKTRNSVRTLALPQQAVDLLIAEHKKHPRNPYLFPSPKTGTMYDPDAFRRTHDKILKAIGAEHIRFHDLRHTFATLSLKSGVDVKTLSGALGHYSAGFTLNTYTHATAQMRQDAADTIGGVISQQMR